MLNNLKEEVCSANLELAKRNLIIQTWGNVSGFDPISKFVIIKPSGIEYQHLTAGNMVVVNLNGEVIEGDYKPSCDTPTHIELYKRYPSLRGIVHTHSTFATSFAQAGEAIPPYGTTHADYFHHEILCTRNLTSEEVSTNYEQNTGKVIVETLTNYDISENRGILVRSHGVFAWGNSPINAVDSAQAIEKIAEMAFLTKQLTFHKTPPLLPEYVLDKHYQRKHGKDAYYGQLKVIKNGI